MLNELLNLFINLLRSTSLTTCQDYLYCIIMVTKITIVLTIYGMETRQIIILTRFFMDTIETPSKFDARGVTSSLGKIPAFVLMDAGTVNYAAGTRQENTERVQRNETTTSKLACKCHGLA